MSSTLERNDLGLWFNGQKTAPRARTRLFCFPYAGGGASIYRGWEHYLPAGVDVWPAQLPGRGSRYREASYGRMDDLVADAAEAMRPHLDLPFSLFGHSFGAMVSFELAHRLREQFGAGPQHLFVSGCRAPHLEKTGRPIHDLPDEQFVSELAALNGTPGEVLENPELIRAMIPTLRADFKLAETYRRTDAPPLGCPVTAFGGTEDGAVPHESLEAWRAQTTGAFNLWLLPGDHFFLHSSDSMVLQILSRELRRVID